MVNVDKLRGGLATVCVRQQLLAEMLASTPGLGLKAV